jgi:hypothetical protein
MNTQALLIVTTFSEKVQKRITCTTELNFYLGIAVNYEQKINVLCTPVFTPLQYTGGGGGVGWGGGSRMGGGGTE